MKNKSGIYAIHCIANDKYYIGKSINTQNRKSQHFNSLKKHCHNNLELQRDFDIYGEDQFEFIELTECPEDMLNHMEHYWIQKYNSINNGYNVINASTNLDLHRSTSDEIDFIELNDEYDKFSKRFLINRFEEDESYKLNLNKLLVIVNLISNQNIDMYFLVKCLVVSNINCYCNITPSNPYYDSYNELNEYEELLSEEMLIDIACNYDTNVYIKAKMIFSRDEKVKLQSYNDEIRKNIFALEEEGIQLKNTIIKTALSFLEFYEKKNFDEINEVITDKKALYEKLNNINNTLNDLEAQII